MKPPAITVWGTGTPRTLRVLWVLHELNLSYKTERIITRTESMDRQDFLAVSPGKKIPALQHGDFTMTESGAITQFLIDNYSEESWTAEQHASIARWSYFVITEIDATALYVIRRHEGLPNIFGEAPAAISSSYEYADRQFNVISDVLEDDSNYLVGGKFSVADVHLVTCIAWARMLKMSLPTKLNSYADRLMARPAFLEASEINAMPASM